MTYGEVRTLVKDSDGCCQDEDRLKVLMVNCLLEMWAELCECPEYQVCLEACLRPCASKGYDMDAETGTPIGQIDTIMREDGFCLKPLPDDKIKAARMGGTTGDPTHYYFWGGNMLLWPALGGSCKLQIWAYRKPDCILFDDVEEGGHTIREWRDIDLPVEFHTVYYKCVLAMAALEMENFEGAQTWLALASAEFDTLKGKKDKGETITSGLLYELDAEDCCDFPIPEPRATEIIDNPHPWEQEKHKWNNARMPLLRMQGIEPFPAILHEKNKECGRESCKHCS